MNEKHEGNEASRVIRELDGLFSRPEEIDGLNLYPPLVRVGDTGTPDLQPLPLHKFGLSWQIVPAGLGDMLQDDDDERAGNVMKAMLEMDKIDLDVLRRAYNHAVTPR